MMYTIVRAMTAILGLLLSEMVVQEWFCGFLLHHDTEPCFQEPAVRNIYHWERIRHFNNGFLSFLSSFLPSFLSFFFLSLFFLEK